MQARHYEADAARHRLEAHQRRNCADYCRGWSRGQREAARTELLCSRGLAVFIVLGLLAGVVLAMLTGCSLHPPPGQRLVVAQPSPSPASACEQFRGAIDGRNINSAAVAHRIAAQIRAIRAGHRLAPQLAEFARFLDAAWAHGKPPPPQSTPVFIRDASAVFNECVKEGQGS
jgi:hypothetical protein